MGLCCCITAILELVVVAVIAAIVVLVVGCGLRSVGSRRPILHLWLISCGCGVVGADSLCPFLLTSMLHQKLALPFSFAFVELFF
jgi:hypothetical protein